MCRLLAARLEDKADLGHYGATGFQMHQFANACSFDGHTGYQIMKVFSVRLCRRPISPSEENCKKVKFHERTETFKRNIQFKGVVAQAQL